MRLLCYLTWSSSALGHSVHSMDIDSTK
ncbi:rCG62882 [Rattus norvegicus]|uniref:RCG62882 n=1 Tax=Rattus norvegicus TaxID=10116 RepID=A6KSQ4_RAT|nr:rCG62882 [Rattus norvegicus]